MVFGNIDDTLYGRFVCRLQSGAGVDDSGEYVRVDWNYINDEFKSFMTCKDDLLEGIRNREIASYHVTGIEEIRIMVNPASRELVQID